MSKTIQTPNFTTAYRNQFAAVGNFDEITAQAVADQQAGITAYKAAKQYATVAEQSHYFNAWCESIKINGPTR